MTAIADTGPGQLIRWHYLGYALVALGVMTMAIASHDHWFLNFVHVICGVLWTGIDLFMGFVIGPILRRVSLSVRREIIVRLVPRTLFLMPTLSIITGTTGWFLAKDLGFLDVPWPQFGRRHRPPSPSASRVNNTANNTAEDYGACFPLPLRDGETGAAWAAGSPAAQMELSRRTGA